MKKILAVALVLVVALTCFGIYKDRTGYDRSPPGTEVHSENITETNVYSFSGSDEVLTVMNGTVILGEDEETFSGGDLKVNSQETLSGVAYYSTTFYILKDGEKRTVLSNSMSDMTGGAVSPDGDLGKISGDDLIVGNKVENIEALENNLYFELKTIDLSGKENVYQLQLTVTKVS